MQRKYFGTDGIRGRFGLFPVTPEFAMKLGWSIGKTLSNEGKHFVMLGKDPRMSGDTLAAALEAGFLSAGVNVFLLGTMPTPGVAFLTQHHHADMGVVVSASHNPYYDNGFKFFGPKGRKLPDNLELKIERALDLPMLCQSAEQLGKSYHLPQAVQEYSAFCKDSLSCPTPFKEFKIILDCANGATSVIAPDVFSELGAQVIALHHEPNGLNINEQCGSTHPASLGAMVVAHGADIGIAFDGDGDRVILVDHTGEIVDGDEILFIIANAYHQLDKLQGGVVGTQMSNLGLEIAFRELNIPFERAKVGDRYVMDKLLENNWRLGGEGSGHIICLDKASTGDGIICALQIVEQMRQSQSSLFDLKKGMIKYEQILLNVPVAKSNELMSHPLVKSAYEDGQNTLKTQGRILLRPSGTEPYIRIMVEGENKALITQVAQTIAQVMTEITANSPLV